MAWASWGGTAPTIQHPLTSPLRSPPTQDPPTPFSPPSEALPPLLPPLTPRMSQYPNVTTMVAPSSSLAGTRTDRDRDGGAEHPPQHPPLSPPRSRDQAQAGCQGILPAVGPALGSSPTAQDLAPSTPIALGTLPFPPAKPGGGGTLWMQPVGPPSSCLSFPLGPRHLPHHHARSILLKYFIFHAWFCFFFF